MIGTIARMSEKPAYEDANLILRLYELRREETMRRARQPGNYK